MWSYIGDGIQSDWPHFVATGKSTCTGSLHVCTVRDCNSTSATPRVVRDKRGGEGGAGNLPSTGHPPMRNFTHWSPCEPMTKFGCFKEETLFFSCRLFPTLPRATSFLEILGLAFFFSFLFVCFIWPLLVLDITILLSWRKNKTWIQTVSIRLESIVDFSNEIGCCKINKKRFVVFVLF